LAKNKKLYPKYKTAIATKSTKIYVTHDEIYKNKTNIKMHIKQIDIKSKIKL
jgi:hypothetical protein